MVSVLLIPCGPACRDQSDPASAFGVDNRENRAVGHSQEDGANLAIVFPIIDPFDSERVTKRRRLKLEAYPVFAEILGGFRIVPLELNYEIRISRSFVNGCEGLGASGPVVVKMCWLPIREFPGRATSGD